MQEFLQLSFYRLDDIRYNDYYYPVAKLKDEIRKALPFAVLEQEASLNVIRTADALSRPFEELAKGTGLSPTQYNVLRILRGAGVEGLPCGQIVERMITRDPDMTRLLDRLEKRELIARSRDARDRRVVRATVTAGGLALLSKLDVPVLEMHRRQLGHMGRNRLKQLIKLLEEARGGPDDGPTTCEGR
jgi:DNA-binding MarR family transcriptional regulator